MHVATPAAMDPAETSPVSAWRVRLLFALVALLSLLFTKWEATSWNDQSRMAMVQALVEHGTLCIDHTDFVATGDKVCVEGRFYSDKLAQPALLGALVYWPLFHLGVRLHAGPCLAYYLITLLVIALPWWLALRSLHSVLGCRPGLARERNRVVMALAFGSLLLPWTTVFSNHSFSAACLTLGFAAILRLRQAAGTRRHAIAAGLALAMAAAADAPTAVFLLGFSLLLACSASQRALLPWLWLGALPAIAPVLLVNFTISGSLLPMVVVPEYFDYPGSPWLDGGGLSGMRTNTPAFAAWYGLTLLVGTKGYVWFNPLVWLALAGLVGCLRRAPRPHDGSLRGEALVCAIGSLALLSYYVMRTNSYGGHTFGPRWLVPLLPLHYVFLAPFLGTAAASSARRRWFALAFVASVAVAVVGLPMPFRGPWRNAEWYGALLGWL